MRVLSEYLPPLECGMIADVEGAVKNMNVLLSDSPYANIPMVKQWLINAGCERIFMVNNVTREGIDELMEYLQEDPPSLTLEQAKFKQSLGLNEWDPLPEGVTYPEGIR